MNTDGTGFNTCKECHKTESLWNHTTTDHKEGEQLEDWRNVGESSCNFRDGTDQTVQTLMFMMMTMMKTKMPPWHANAHCQKSTSYTVLCIGSHKFRGCFIQNVWPVYKLFQLPLWTLLMNHFVQLHRQILWH